MCTELRRLSVSSVRRCRWGCWCPSWGRRFSTREPAGRATSTWGKETSRPRSSARKTRTPWSCSPPRRPWSSTTSGRYRDERKAQDRPGDIDQHLAGGRGGPGRSERERWPPCRTARREGSWTVCGTPDQTARGVAWGLLTVRAAHRREWRSPCKSTPSTQALRSPARRCGPRRSCMEVPDGRQREPYW